MMTAGVLQLGRNNSRTLVKVESRRQMHNRFGKYYSNKRWIQSYFGKSKGIRQQVGTPRPWTACESNILNVAMLEFIRETETTTRLPEDTRLVDIRVWKRIMY